MNILACGDFHGVFPQKLTTFAKQSDAVISNGDFVPFTLRDEYFKHSYRTQTPLWKAIGKTRVKDVTLADWKKAETVFAKLQKLPVPVYTVTGNLDYTKHKDAHRVYDKKSKSEWPWMDQDFFTPRIKKYPHINVFDFKAVRCGDFILIGYPRSTFPGQIQSKQYRLHRARLDKLFLRHKKDNIIFVSHNVPHNTKIDKIVAKDAHKLAQNKHFGSKLVRRLIERYQPKLFIGGHIHESFGTDKIGSTLCVNPGAVHDKQCCMITVGRRISTKFIEF